MSKKIECDIIRDLMPSYVDGLTSEKTNQAVLEHMEECLDCREMLNRMKESENEPASEAEKKEVDYLKKIKRKFSTKSFVRSIILLLIGMGLIGIRTFYVGRLAKVDDVVFHTQVQGNEVFLTGNMIDSNTSVARIAFEESAGIVTVKVYAAPASPFTHNSFQKNYRTNVSQVEQVRCENRVIWQEMEISTTAGKLFEAYNPYVGDMPADNRIADILGISDQFGPYSNELETVSAPYGWKLVLTEVVKEKEEKRAQEIMTANSYILIATIGNLNYVTWEYETETGIQSFTVTEEEASEYKKCDIKEFGTSASKLQELLTSLSVKGSGVKNLFQDNESFYINIINRWDSEIYSVGMKYYLNGKSVGGTQMCNADNTALQKGDQIFFEILSIDFPKDTSTIALADFSFDLTLYDRNGNIVHSWSGIKQPAKYGWSYPFEINDEGEWLLKQK